jgi:TPR repeat protein
MDKKLIIGALVVLLVIITIGVATAEDVDQIGHRYFLVSDVDSMLAYGDSHSGPTKTFTSNKLALKWYRKAAERGNATAMVRMGTIYREGWSDEEDYWKAIDCYQNAVELDSLNIEALTELGGTFGLEAGDYKSGHSYLDMALEIDSTYLDALWYKACFYVKQDNDVQMKKIIQKIDIIDSTFVDRKIKEMNDD